MDHQDYLTSIRTEIRQDKMDAALKLLQELLDGSSLFDELIAQSGRYKAVKKEIRLGTISHDDATVELNKFRKAILDFLTEIEIAEIESSEIKEATKAALSSPVYKQWAKNINNINTIEGGAVFN